MEATTATYVAYVALAGVLISAVVSFINGIWTNRYNTGNLAWQQEQWIKNKKQEVFFGCLKCLGESMPLPIDGDHRPVSIRQAGSGQESYIDNQRFLGMMQSLQYAGSWLTMVEGYCSSNTNAKGVKDRREKFLRCLNLVLQEVIVYKGDKGVRNDCGFSKSHQDVYEYVMKLAAIELLIGRVPTPEE